MRRSLLMVLALLPLLSACRRDAPSTRAANVPYLQTSGGETNLAGRDVDRDGVRDDVGLWVQSRSRGGVAQAELALARGFQQEVTGRTAWARTEAAQQLLGARICLKRAAPRDWSARLKAVEARVLNNALRRDAAQATRTWLAGRPVPRVSACPTGAPRPPV